MASEQSDSTSIETIAHERGEWNTNRSITTVGEIDTGDWVEFTKTVSEEDVEQFAEASGDTNKLHLDAEFAEDSRFGRRIIHGTLVSGLVSAALARLPGTVIFLSNEQRFEQPGYIDDTLTARCTVINVDDNRYQLETEVENEAGDTLLSGNATVLIDSGD